MAFVAKSSEHAIVEVVFGLLLARPWQPAEIEALAQNHDRWKNELPRLARHEIQQIVVGEAALQALALPGGPGISFERIKPNGELAWRLRCDGNALFVNCLEYSRWYEVWANALRYMRDALEAVGAEKISIAGALLQYIDVFDWNGKPAEYDIFQLLDQSSRYIPDALGDYGPAWHLYQGWFEPLDGPIAGRVLHKAHFDALPRNEAGQPTVKMDTLLRSDFNGRISAQQLFDANSPLDAVFVTMHDMNKQLLSHFLVETIRRSIGLEEIP